MVDQALFLLGDSEVRVFADLKRALSVGDAEDHVKIVLQPEAADGPTLDIELTSASAYVQENWHVMGTSGGLKGTMTHLEWKWVDWSTMPPRPLNRGPAEQRKYNREALQWQEDHWNLPEDLPNPQEMYYRDLFQTIRAGKPQFVTPQSVRRQIQVMDACREACAV